MALLTEAPFLIRSRRPPADNRKTEGPTGKWGLRLRVELTGQLSNLCPAAERMLAKKKSQVSRTLATPRPQAQRQKHVRLSDAQRAELVARHRDGAFKKELARAYGIHVETVRAIIRRAEI